MTKLAKKNIKVVAPGGNKWSQVAPAPKNSQEPALGCLCSSVVTTSSEAKPPGVLA